MKNTWRDTIIWIFLAFFAVQCKQNGCSSNEFDQREAETLEDKIIWSEDKKLKWSDFVYNPTEESFKIYAKVGLSARYNVDPSIMLRSKTTFSPTESIVSDTTNLNDLRVAQIKFDLLETYRRKLEKEVDSIRKLELTNLKPSEVDNWVNQYYKEFETEWNSFKPTLGTAQLDSLENQINGVLK
jgi:hypothetical protein